jgi:type II secretory pathway pseudopilin PulG
MNARTTVCRQSDERGFTLAEVLIAMAILMAAAYGVARLGVAAMHGGQAARSLTTCTLLAVQKMEQLRSLTWTYAGDERTAPGVSDLSTDLSREPFSSGGRGLLPSPAGSLDRDTAGYVDYLDGRGRWVNGGGSPGPDAVYIRRWRVEPLASDPDDSLLLQVLVTTVATERRLTLPAGSRRSVLAGDASLATILTRRLP